jgi:hypothetical protein
METKQTTILVIFLLYFLFLIFELKIKNCKKKGLFGYAMSGMSFHKGLNNSLNAFLICLDEVNTKLFENFRVKAPFV